MSWSLQILVAIKMTVRRISILLASHPAWVFAPRCAWTNYTSCTVAGGSLERMKTRCLLFGGIIPDGTHACTDMLFVSTASYVVLTSLSLLSSTWKENFLFLLQVHQHHFHTSTSLLIFNHCLFLSNRKVFISKLFNQSHWCRFASGLSSLKVPVRYTLSWAFCLLAFGFNSWSYLQWLQKPQTQHSDCEWQFKMNGIVNINKF